MRAHWQVYFQAPDLSPTPVPIPSDRGRRPGRVLGLRARSALGTGRDVVASPDLGHQPEFESERDDFGIGVERVAAAHGG